MAASPTALVLGASRGIGKAICLALAKAGYNIGVSFRTTERTAKLPWTIFDTAKEVESLGLGLQACPIECNVRNVEDINSAVKTCISNFGSLDVVVYNSGAIMWKKVIDTSMKKFNLLLDVNVKGAYALESISDCFFARALANFVGKLGTTYRTSKFGSQLANELANFKSKFATSPAQKYG